MLRTLALFALFGCSVAAISAGGKKQPTDTDVVEADEKYGKLAGRGTTPVKKVIQLLKKIEAQVEEDGKKEAADYDKFSCFCKEQADEKLYSIEKSTKKINKLSAQISKLAADISALNSQVADLSRTIMDREWEIGNATRDRAAEHDTYVEREAEAAGAIDSSERAIAALSDSKGDLSGKVNQNAFVQIRRAAVKALAFASAFGGLTQQQTEMLRSFTKTHAPDDGVADAGEAGKAYTYTYHSNDIIEMIKDLRKKFIAIRDDLDTTEFKQKEAFDSKVLGLANEKKFAEEEKATKDKIIAYKTEVKEEATGDKLRETSMNTSDTNFLDVLKQECEGKATTWDQRSTVRSGELTAISQALEELETGVKPNWGANKKLSGLLQVSKQGGPRLSSMQAVFHDELKPSFLQLRQSGGNLRGQGATSIDKVRQQVLNILYDGADKFHSRALSTLALRVEASEDHFIRIRQLIKDLIAQLKQQASDEASHKTYCDTEIKAAVTTRDSEAAKKEDAAALIENKKGQIKNLKMDISTLSDQIADNEKALSEQTELRNEESAANTQTVNDARDGKAAVDRAINILKPFYASVALQQSGKKYVPPNSDRDGSTVSDLAPDVFENNVDYKAKQTEAKGVIGMLEIISSDFQRTDTTVTDEETVAVTDFNTFKTANEADTSTKKTSVSTKQGSIDTLDDDIVTQETNLDNAKTAYDLAIDELEDLHKLCVAGEETYDERVEKRAKEIEALKEAHNILENWQS